MLVFVMPLQGRRASKDWSQVSALARRALNSALAQDHPDFHVLLVCDEEPENCPSHPKLTKVHRTSVDTASRDHTTRMQDKSNKLLAGLIAARKFAPCHVMLADADDCVSRRLARHVASHPASNGWYFDKGLLHDEGKPLIFQQNRDFDRVCGTSSILRVTPEDLPEDQSEGWGQHMATQIYNEGHHQIREIASAKGHPLDPLPFAGAVYILATGENNGGASLHTWNSKKMLLKKLLHYRLLTRRYREDFGLWELDHHV